MDLFKKMCLEYCSVGKGKFKMKYIEKNRFLVWLMFAPFLFLFGLPVLIGWSVIQVCICNKEKKEEKIRQMPIQLRPEIIEMNKPENLTEADIKYFDFYEQYTKEKGKGWIKVTSGVPSYEYVEDEEKK